MIPILYTPLETAFTSNGIGRLTDCISCTVTEERNGIFECEFEYPINGKFYSYLISNACFVGVIHDDHKDVQPFEVYRHSDPINGVVTFNAHHISYNLGNVIVNDIHADTVADALDQFTTHNITENSFSFWTDKATSGTFEVIAPDNVRALLGGQEGSILDVYGGGEYEFDLYTVKLYANRGMDRGVTIRYGKNLTDINRTYDASDTFNAVVPFWSDEEGNTVTLPEGFIAETTSAVRYPWENEINGEIMQDGQGHDIEFNHFTLKAVALDLSSEFEEEPTIEELRSAAVAYLTSNRPWLPSDNIKVNFIQLWQTPEYENIAALQRVSLCDTVSVFYPEMEIAVSAKVIKIVYNVLAEQYDSMELGQANATLADTIKGDLSSQISQVSMDSRSFTEKAIAEATSLITGGLGGYVVMNLNASGEPQEILIMDTDDINTAVNVIRMNKNGIGFSRNGYEGPYTSAWTIDGAFNADFITTGTMLANRIYGGTLTVGGMDNQAGVFQIKNAGGQTVVTGNKDGLTTTVLTATDYIYVDGTSGSYLKIPWTVEGKAGYIEISSNGLRFVQGDTDIKLRPLSGDFGTLSFVDNGKNRDSSMSASAIGLTNSSNNIVIYPDYIQIAANNSQGDNWVQFGLLYTMCRNNFYVDGNAQISGQLSIGGTKSRIVKTKEYGERLLYCYETPSPLFGDVGEGVIDETGSCYVFLDPVFAETIATSQYQVFLQKYGNGDCWIADRKAGYFVVQGTVGMSFGWELKAKQADFSQLRLDKKMDEEKPNEPNYGQLAIEFLTNLQEGRITV